MRNVRDFAWAMAALAFLFCFSQLARAATLDVKVLVISTGTAQEDQGLDLIDDMLNEVGVSYEVLDSSRQTLTAEFLSDGTHGRFNGVILTDSMLYFTGPGNYLNSGFSLEEWQLLHQYERDFNVRESVLSGYPASGPYFKVVYDLDYGMDLNTLTPGSQFQGVWQAPAGGTDLFEYVNTANPLPVNDYSVAVEPVQGSLDPVVEPLLRDGDSARTLVSRLTYADGREVLYSGITNAWYLVHSQVLNYEFLNFATRGLFLGSRKVYLAAHVDDLFLADDVWDPVNNVTTGAVSYRNSSADIDNLIVQQNAFNNRFATAGNFKLDMAFNGGGAVTIPARKETLVSDADAWMARIYSTSRLGRQYYGYTGSYLLLASQVAVKFPVNAPYNPYANSAVLTLTGRTSSTNGQICRITAPWDEATVTWQRSNATTYWASRAGASYDASSCIAYTQVGGKVTANITPIVNQWLSGQAPNYGVVLVGGASNWVYTREYSQAAGRPQLTIDYPLTTSDPLTAAIMQHKTGFRFINHTYTHADMFTSAGTTYATAFEEIAKNIEFWDLLGLPELVDNTRVLISGNHSGLDDTMGTELDPSDDLPYPQGRNTAFIDAARAVGIRYLASDSSRLNQDREDYVPGTNNEMILLPRYPTAVFYNATTPAELEDEYNYIFHERYINAGQNPCAIPGAICAPRSYAQILAAEADTTLRHMLTYRTWPHYFHISNLRDYGAGKTLQFDWLNSVMARYESLLKLPVVNAPYYAIGERTRQRIEARNAGVQAVYDDASQTVTVSASRPAVIEATGLSNGSVYGGQRQSTLSVGELPVTYIVDDGSAF